MKVNQAVRLFLAALVAGSSPLCISADPCPPVAGICPPSQADEKQQVMQCKGCFYGGECEAQGAGFSLEDDCQAVGVQLDPTKPCKGNLRRGSQCLQTTWSQVAKLTAVDGTANDSFGYSVAVSGETAIVGASGNSGAAYIFEKIDGSWNQVAKLEADVNPRGFGDSVAISGDTAIVGAWADDDRGTGSGSAYIFEKVDGSWMNPTVTKLTAYDGTIYDRFGYSVAISGATAIIGAYGDKNDGEIDSGSAYIFEKAIGGSWNQVAKLTADDGASSDFFGSSVAISGDTAIVGSYGDDDVDRGIGSGSAYIFEKVDGSWMNPTVTKLTAYDGAEFDYFGSSVAISGDTAIVGSYADDDVDRGSGSGSAYIFEKVDGSWMNPTVTKLTAYDGAEFDYFGQSVAISGDTAIVGAIGDDDVEKGTNAGSAYIFKKVDGSWMNPVVTKLTADDGAGFDFFGRSVAISGETAIIGADGDDGRKGSAYIFE